MRVADFDYELPEELIAQYPLDRRDAARMLVVERAQGHWRDSAFSELPAEIAAGDVIVINNTRVFPARLTGRREPTGGRVELLLLRRHEARSHSQIENKTQACDESRQWVVLARPARRLEIGALISFGEGRLRAEVLGALNDGQRLVRFACDDDFDALLEEVGQTPLPPYIRRSGADAPVEDRERYQTIYAQRRGAIAAPTAGLHFTRRVLDELQARGVHLAEVTLHVGYGTFAPVRVDDLSVHQVAPERYEIDSAAAASINNAKKRGRRIIAIGTTTVRALESAVDAAGRVAASAGETCLTITPGHQFRAVDALLTNFHLPRSSLLVLVGAFAGRELALAAYAHAVKSRYRFYSYGDCMLIS